jgi:hypothetical protein
MIFSKAHTRVFRGYRANRFNFVDVFGKGARGRIQQGTAAGRINVMYTLLIVFQAAQPI